MGTELASGRWSLVVFVESRSRFADLSAELEMLLRKKTRWATKLASRLWSLVSFVKRRSGFADLSAELEML